MKNIIYVIYITCSRREAASSCNPFSVKYFWTRAGVHPLMSGISSSDVDTEALDSVEISFAEGWLPFWLLALGLEASLCDFDWTPIYIIFLKEIMTNFKLLHYMQTTK